MIRSSTSGGAGWLKGRRNQLANLLFFGTGPAGWVSRSRSERAKKPEDRIGTERFPQECGAASPFRLFPDHLGSLARGDNDWQVAAFSAEPALQIDAGDAGEMDVDDQAQQ